MFFNALEKLRRKPAHVKRVIALATSGSITFVLAVLWAVSFTGYISEKTQKGVLGTVAIPFKEMVGSVFDGFSGIQKRASSMFKDDFSSIESRKSATTSVSTYVDSENVQSEVKKDSVATSTSEKELIQ